MHPLTRRSAKKLWIHAAVVLLPLLIAACASSPAQLAADLPEPDYALQARARPPGAPAKQRHLAARSTKHVPARIEMLRASVGSGKTHAIPAVLPRPREPAPDDVPRTESPQTQEPAREAEIFEWPVEGRIILPFGRADEGQRNDGINIATPPGTPIHAAAAGTVTYADRLKGYGRLVLIRHDNGYITAYAHAETLLVSNGDHVARGDVIGYAGKSGDVASPQLHFEIRRGVKPLDPKPLLMAAGES